MTNKSKGFFVLFMIFIFMCLLNCFTPLLNEDYFAAFVWPEGVPNLGTLPENVRRVASLSDVLENCRVYYLSEGGRIPGGLLLGVIFWDLGKTYFNPFNALIMTILVMEIYWLSHEGVISFSFNPSKLIWIFFSLWAFNISFIDTCLWMSGSSNYLWMMVIVLAFLLPYVRNYYDENFLKKDSLAKTAGMFFLGIIAGWSHETTIFWLIILLGYWLFQCWKKGKFQFWKIFGYVGFCIGYSFLILAPGNFSRLHNASEQAGTGLVFIGHNLFYYKLIELGVILFFQLFLWHFMISFFIHYKKYFEHKDDAASAFIVFAKACFFVAFCSTASMFVLPVSGLRPAFLNLCFLTLGTFTLFRVIEHNNIRLLKNPIILCFKCIGCTYLILTVTFSVYGNFLNWQYWNGIIETINHDKELLKTNILEILPPKTDEKYLFWRLASGSHLIYVPVVSDNENERVNKIIAQYYAIKGIKVVY